MFRRDCIDVSLAPGLLALWATISITPGAGVS
jgi:hypothetical protein